MKSTLWIASAAACIAVATLGGACGSTSDTTDPTGTGTGGAGGSAPTCAAPQLLCDGACLDVRFDPSNCGACGTACGDGEVCSGGKCALQCSGGTSECEVGGQKRCVDLQVDGANCGACGTACTADQVCSVGACDDDCNGGTDKCDVDGKAACFNLKNDPAHCGGCDTACGADESCIDGACKVACFAGTTVCSVPKPADPGTGGAGGAGGSSGAGGSAGGMGGAGGSMGPEMMDVCVDLKVDPLHCGACGNACEAADAVSFCASGSCEFKCNAGFDNCDGLSVTGCESELAVDDANCGACGNACGAGAKCFLGTCLVNMGFELQNYTGWDISISQLQLGDAVLGIVANQTTLNYGDPLFDFVNGQSYNLTSVGLPITYQATEGDFLGVVQVNGPTETRLSRVVPISKDATKLKWDMAYTTHEPLDADFQYAALELYDLNGNLLETPFKTIPGDPESVPTMTTFSVDVSAYAGTSIRFGLVLHQDLFYFDLAFDNFRIE